MKYPLAIACLIAAVGCGRGVVPQTSTPDPVTVTKYVYKSDTVEIAPSNDFFLGDDCTGVQDALAKCEADVNGLLAENAGLKEQLSKSGKKVKIKNSYNTDNSQVINLRKSNQMLAQDNARLKADSAVMAGKLQAGNMKKSGNTKEGKDRFWLGVLVATAAFQGLRLAKKYAVLLPPPFGLILYKVLNLIA